MPLRALKLCRGCGVIKSRIAKLEARYRVDPSSKLVTPEDVQSWRDRGLSVPDCLPNGEELWQWLEKCSDAALHGFIVLHQQSGEGGHT